MDEILLALIGIPGALVRWGFFSLFGRRKRYLEYLNDDYDTVNVLIGFVIVAGYFILTSRK
jgi:hypothetical protein